MGAKAQIRTINQSDSWEESKTCLEDFKQGYVVSAIPKPTVNSLINEIDTTRK